MINKLTFNWIFRSTLNYFKYSVKYFKIVRAMQNVLSVHTRLQFTSEKPSKSQQKTTKTNLMQTHFPPQKLSLLLIIIYLLFFHYYCFFGIFYFGDCCFCNFNNCSFSDCALCAYYWKSGHRIQVFWCLKAKKTFLFIK